MKPPVILASQSPRRRELFRKIFPSFEAVCPQVKESDFARDPVDFYPERLARAKALSIAKKAPESLVVGCDTAVICDETILGKPKNYEDARNMLGLLSGRTHRVITGVCFVYKEKTMSFSQTTQVTFFPLSKREIEEYLQTDEPWDKAGGYAIQGKGAFFIGAICGDFYNVVGLPLARCKREWDRFLQEIGDF